MLDIKTMIVALVVVLHLGKEENIYLRGITMVRMFGGVEVMFEEYTLIFGKTIYGVTLVKMVLH